MCYDDGMKVRDDMLGRLGAGASMLRLAAGLVREAPTVAYEHLCEKHDDPSFDGGVIQFVSMGHDSALDLSDIRPVMVNDGLGGKPVAGRAGNAAAFIKEAFRRYRGVTVPRTKDLTHTYEITQSACCDLLELPIGHRTANVLLGLVHQEYIDTALLEAIDKRTADALAVREEAVLDKHASAMECKHTAQEMGSVWMCVAELANEAAMGKNDHFLSPKKNATDMDDAMTMLEIWRSNTRSAPTFDIMVAELEKLEAGNRRGIARARTGKRQHRDGVGR